MFDALKRNVRQLRVGLHRIEARGHSRQAALLLHLPEVLVRRAYAVVTKRLHHSGIIAAVNRIAFRKFERQHGSQGEPLFYVIVMPGTLHFLVPSLAMLPSTLSVRLLANGAAAWEKRYLARTFPRYPIFDLATLPGAAIAHGDVLTLLLTSAQREFGVLDHDCYVFDASIFERMALREGDCVTAVYCDTATRVMITYPHTYLLYFDAAALRSIMDRYAVDANAYRKLPCATVSALASIGIRDGVFLKDYHDYYDTLHVLLLLALAEGLNVRFVESVEDDSIAHLGSTSSGIAHTKDLMSSYIELRFLELLDDAEVSRRYRSRTEPFRASKEARTRIPNTPDAYARMQSIDALVERLAARTGKSTARD